MQGMRFRAGLPIVAVLVAVFALCGTVVGQFSLSTPFDQNNGQNGNMFDIVVGMDAITITSVDVHIPTAGPHDFEIWPVILDPLATNGTPGSLIQNPATQTDMLQWNLEATVTGVMGLGNDIPTPLGPNIMSLALAAGETRGLYVTSTNGGILRYTNGLNFGGTRAANSHLTITEGFGNAYPFGAAFGGPTPGATSRMWNGVVHYTAPFTEGNGQAPQPGLAVLSINDTVDANGIPLGNLNPATMSPIKGPFFSSVAVDSEITFSFSGAPSA